MEVALFIYPGDYPQPIKEDYILSGKLESTNESYSIAKIAGIKMYESCNRQNDRLYIIFMPSDLDSHKDNYSLTMSRVLPALIRNIHTAKVRREKFIPA